MASKPPHTVAAYLETKPPVSRWASNQGLIESTPQLAAWAEELYRAAADNPNLGQKYALRVLQDLAITHKLKLKRPLTLPLVTQWWHRRRDKDDGERH